MTTNVNIMYRCKGVISLLLLSSGQQNKSALQAQEVLAQFDKIDNGGKSLLQERELQFRDHKAFRMAQEILHNIFKDAEIR